MSWLSLEESSSSSSEASEEFLDSVTFKQEYEDDETHPEKNHDEKSAEINKSIPWDLQVICRTGDNYDPLTQEITSEKNFTESPKSNNHLKALLIRKDEYISNLNKLLSCQREQLYFFLKMSINENMLTSFKNTCQDFDSLYDNENLSMALDRFKQKCNIPSEQTLLREDILKTLMKLERIMKQQENLAKCLEKEFLRISISASTDGIDLYQYKIHDIYQNRLLRGTQQLFQSLESLRIQLKRIGLIEDERIHLIERVYSLPSSQRQYYAHLMVLEKEKLRLQDEIQELKDKSESLRKTTEILQESVNSKIGDFDLNLIKPGLETHVKIMEMVERGELFLVTMTRDEKGKFKDEYSKLCAENRELTKRLKDFDKAVEEGENLKKQVNFLIENCSQMKNEIRKLRRINKTEELLNELKETSAQKEQIKMQLDKIARDGPSVLRICGESITQIVEERDQLRLKLTEYLSMEEDIKKLKQKASLAENYQREAEELKNLISELEEIKISYLALVDKNGHNLDLVNPADREKYRNMCQELNYLKIVLVQRENLIVENMELKRTIERQGNEITEMLKILDRLNFKSKEDRNKIDQIKERNKKMDRKSTRMKIKMMSKPNPVSGGLGVVMAVVKYFLRFGFLPTREKTFSLE